MPRRTIDVSRFLESAPAADFNMDINESPETPTQRRERITRAMERAAETKGAIIENAAENERLRRIHRKAKTDLFLNMNDLMGGVGRLPPADLFPEERMGMSMPQGHQMLTEEFPTLHDDAIMNELYNGPRQPQQQRRPQQQRALREDMVQQPRRQAPQLDLRGQSKSGDNWIAKKYLGETRGGDTVPIWKIENKKTGNSMDKLFRAEGVANRIALMLNETSDLSDPRVVGLVSAYDKRDKLLKEARLLEKTAEGKPMKQERLRAIRAEINQLDYRLAI